MRTFGGDLIGVQKSKCDTCCAMYVSVQPHRHKVTDFLLWHTWPHRRICVRGICTATQMPLAHTATWPCVHTGTYALGQPQHIFLSALFRSQASTHVPAPTFAASGAFVLVCACRCMHAHRCAYIRAHNNGTCVRHKVRALTSRCMSATYALSTRCVLLQAVSSTSTLGM